MKEWSVADEILETFQGVDNISCSEEQKAANGELFFQKLDGELLVKEFVLFLAAIRFWSPPTFFITRFVKPSQGLGFSSSRF